MRAILFDDRAAPLRALARWSVGILALPLLSAAVAVSRWRRAQRRGRGERPRLIWGPVPIIAIKYWSQALRDRGFESRTCVFDVYAINSREDFDAHYKDFLADGVAFDPLRPYAVFLWALKVADVYLCYFDGGFLQGTALRWLELPLLRLAGIRVIVSPYGSDIAVPGHLGVAEQPLLRDYPAILTDGPAVQRRVDHFCRWADLVIRNYQYGYLPKWDTLWPTMIAIDTEQWRSSSPLSDADGRNEEVTIVHAPNHRHIKGTDRLIEAVEQLRNEGLRVRLQLIERRPNEEVRAAVSRCDIVAEQFIAGYALFAIEGMAAERAVLSALGWMPTDVREDLERRDIPIIDADTTTLVDRLRLLVTEPALRRQLGEQGRRFVLANHSYDAVGSVWEAIIRHVWYETPMPRNFIEDPTH
jgi:glycosyltransferase involved in cell wall biosynthesis